MAQLRSVVLLSFILGAACFAQQQNSGTPVTIEVSDPSTARIPHAQVTIMPVSFPMKLATDEHGAVHLPLSPGTYEVKVSSPGFRTSTKRIDVPVSSKDQKVGVVLLTGPASSAEVTHLTADEEAVWKLERAYWGYVQALDLENYRGLWHPDFLGWPSVSSSPRNKGQITDWITDFTSQGLHLKSFDLRPTASRQNGNSVVTFYTITATWVDKDGRGKPATSRLTHTWGKTGNTWQIISGMSAAVNDAAQ